METIDNCLRFTLNVRESLAGILGPIFVIPSAVLCGGMFVVLIFLIRKYIIKKRNKLTTSNQYVVNENPYVGSDVMVSLWFMAVSIDIM